MLAGDLLQALEHLGLHENMVVLAGNRVIYSKFLI